MKLGIVSDTHGLLRPEVAPALKGVDRILHLGDVGKTSVLESFRKDRAGNGDSRQRGPRGRLRQAAGDRCRAH